MLDLPNPANLSRRRLKVDATFTPCEVQAGEEIYPNGIFEYNVSQLLAFLEAHPERFPIESIEVASIANFGPPKDEQAVRTADLSRPILLAEIAPGRYNLIDGHHRMERARREATLTLPGRRIPCPDHLAFLTSRKAYETYVDYWNGKLLELMPRPRRSHAARGRSF